MTNSETKTLQSQLALVQGQLSNPTADAKGQIQNRSFKYAPLDKALDEIRPILCEHGLSLTQVPKKEVIVNATGQAQVLLLLHSQLAFGDECITADYVLGFAPMQDKEYGAKITYGRRYTLFGLLNIIGDEDLDVQGLEGNRPQQTKTPQQKAAETRAKNKAAKTADEAKAGARKWIETQITNMRNMTDSRTLVSWQIDNKDALAKLKKEHPALYDEVMAEKETTLVRLGPAK